jgi:hypothetical protein
LDAAFALFLANEELLTGEQNIHWQHKRLDWNQHVQKLLHEKCFHIQYCMLLKDFGSLLLVKLLGGEVGLNSCVNVQPCPAVDESRQYILR